VQIEVRMEVEPMAIIGSTKKNLEIDPSRTIIGDRLPDHSRPVWRNAIPAAGRRSIQHGWARLTWSRYTGQLSHRRNNQ